MSSASLAPAASRWELAAEAIAVRIRWFGLLVGCALALLADAGQGHRAVLGGILGLGAGFAVLDSLWSLRGRVFLGRHPLFVSAMEALFIGLLCFFSGGLDSLFRYYYFLSLICCAIRHSARVTYATCALHCVSYSLLYFALPPGRGDVLVLGLTVVILAWVTWASVALAVLLKRVGDHLGRLNVALQENQRLLESRIAERTRELQEAQAHVLHQEKMAAFGLLAAGIAHEVGNPLTSISSMVQILRRRGCDDYTRDRLALVDGQLQRIQGTLRELVNFSRPASTVRSRVAIAEVLAEACHVAKYYQRTRGRTIDVRVAPDLPALEGVRDQLVQVFLNLLLNAIDATAKGGRIGLTAEPDGDGVVVTVRDDGPGIAPELCARLFQAYSTTKPQGTGLGLFVTARLVADHGGTVTCESAPGAGAAFRVRLPAARSALPAGGR